MRKEKSWKKVIQQYRANRARICRLREEEVAQDVEVKVIKATHAQLYGELKGRTYIISSVEEKLGEAYNLINFLEKGVTELK
jgi:hypothetical protein